MIEVIERLQAGHILLRIPLRNAPSSENNSPSNKYKNKIQRKLMGIFKDGAVTRSKKKNTCKCNTAHENAGYLFSKNYKQDPATRTRSKESLMAPD